MLIFSYFHCVPAGIAFDHSSCDCRQMLLLLSVCCCCFVVVVFCFVLLFVFLRGVPGVFHITVNKHWL